MIEVKKEDGALCVLMLRAEFYAATPEPKTVFMQAQPRDVAKVVAAGNPAITRELRAIGWDKVSAAWSGLVTRVVLHDEIDEDPDLNRIEARLVEQAAEIIRLREELHAEKRRGDDRVNAITDNAVPYSDVEDERAIVRRIVRAGVDLMVRYLDKKPIAGSVLATDLNDAIHDWIGTQDPDVVTRALEEYIERRALPRVGQPAPGDAPKFRVELVPPLPEPELEGLATRVFWWGVGKLWPAPRVGW